ncbi:MAG: hypothetical protein ABSE16_20525 [Verrucomicrobiota bacterium]
MSVKLTIVICLAMGVCGCAKRDPGYNFKPVAFGLKDVQDYWISHGRPLEFRPSEVSGNPGEIFVFTNIVKTTNGVLHCRFGARRLGWPPGVLAITDEGFVIFIRERDGRVIFSPEDNGVEY